MDRTQVDAQRILETLPPTKDEWTKPEIMIMDLEETKNSFTQDTDGASMAS